MAKISADNHQQPLLGQEPDSWLSRNLANLLLVGVGALQALVLIRQAGLAETQISITERQRELMDGQLKAAIMAANAAQTSADAALYAELPLFIVSEPRAAVATGRSTDGSHGAVIKNEGRTGARVTASFLSVHTGYNLDGARFPLEWRRQLPQEFFLAPGHTYSVRQDQRIDAAAWQRIMAGKVLAWIYGYIEYTDFTETRRQFGFCFCGIPRRPTLFDTMSPDHLQWVRHGGAEWNYHRKADEPRP